MAHFYVDGMKRGERSKLDLRLEVLRNNVGYPIPWGELVNFSEDLIQLIQGVFIGTKAEVNDLTYPTKDLNGKYDIILGIEDGGWWDIDTNDETFYNKLITKYRIAEYLD